MSTEFDNILFDMPKTQSNHKVIGVGGGGKQCGQSHVYPTYKRGRFCDLQYRFASFGK